MTGSPAARAKASSGASPASSARCSRIATASGARTSVARAAARSTTGTEPRAARRRARLAGNCGTKTMVRRSFAAPVWAAAFERLEKPMAVPVRLVAAFAAAISFAALAGSSAPHGVIVGPDAAPWVTDGGQNAIVRVDPKTHAVRAWRLPPDSGYANLNTLAFDRKGKVWFTGQSGIYGRLDPASGEVKVWKAPRGNGPYGITATPSGDVYYASLAGSHIARIDVDTGNASVIEPPTPRQGARRVSSDSRGRIWVSYWNTGQVGMYDPAANAWREWKLPGNAPHVYSVWVDPSDHVWLTEWTSNAIVRFDPVSERFESFPSNRSDAGVRQMLGRAGEAWGAESGNDRLVMVPAR